MCAQNEGIICSPLLRSSTPSYCVCVPRLLPCRVDRGVGSIIDMALTVAVKRAFARLAPTSLAEPWVSSLALFLRTPADLPLAQDNVGLILEPSFARPSAPRVLLTIDLTTSVADEALAADSGVGCIVAYHPTIFGGLKSFTLGNPLQKTLLRCAAAGIGCASSSQAARGSD